MEQEQQLPVRRRRNKQQIEELLQSFANSKESVIDFCKERNISPANFHKWRSRYKIKPDGNKNKSAFAFVDIVSCSPATPRGLFAEVNGIRLYQSVSAAYIKELLA